MSERVVKDDLKVIEDHDVRDGKHLRQTCHVVSVRVCIQGRHHVAGNMLWEEHVLEQHSYAEENTDNEHDKDETEQKYYHSAKSEH